MFTATYLAHCRRHFVHPDRGATDISSDTHGQFSPPFPTDPSLGVPLALTPLEITTTSYEHHNSIVNIIPFRLDNEVRFSVSLTLCRKISGSNRLLSNTPNLRARCQISSIEYLGAIATTQIRTTYGLHHNFTMHQESPATPQNLLPCFTFFLAPAVPSAREAYLQRGGALFASQGEMWLLH
jgi:hypothetical protein